MLNAREDVPPKKMTNATAKINVNCSRKEIIYTYTVYTDKGKYSPPLFLSVSGLRRRIPKSHI